jgi:hypothetical protein
MGHLSGHPAPVIGYAAARPGSRRGPAPGRTSRPSRPRERPDRPGLVRSGQADETEAEVPRPNSGSSSALCPRNRTVHNRQREGRNGPGPMTQLDPPTPFDPPRPAGPRPKGGRRDRPPPGLGRPSLHGVGPGGRGGDRRAAGARQRRGLPVVLRADAGRDPRRRHRRDVGPVGSGSSGSCPISTAGSWTT